MITGEESEKENDLIRYSNYMSGAGSTFGGFMAELPGDIGDITDGRNIINKHLNAMITLLYSANLPTTCTHVKWKPWTAISS